MSARAFNFCSGPANLPTEVLLQAQEQLLDWNGHGCSVMELSHRSGAFRGVIEQAEADLRQLLGIPMEYKVLFLQGGASLQFSAVPLNLAGLEGTPAYIDTGIWSRKAQSEAERYGPVRQAATASGNGYTSVIPASQWQLDEQVSWVHYTPNETIGGLEYLEVPDVGDHLLVADASSTLLSRPVDVSRFGLIYAGAQKNIGPAGLTLVIVREDLLGLADHCCPHIMNYAAAAENESMTNTPPTFAIYLAGLVFRWVINQGGLAAMAERNQRKAKRLYDYLDESAYYTNPISPESRSWMNVPFTLANESENDAFLEGAGRVGLINLQGHRSVGGMRASLYNAMPEEGVTALLEYMNDFAASRGYARVALADPD